MKQWPLPSLQPVAPSHLLSVSMTWPTLCISYKWSHVVFAASFLALASFSCYTIFKIHLCCSIYLKFSPFFFKTIHSFVYFRLHRIFIAILRLSSCEWGLLSGCGVKASHSGGFSCCRALAVGHAGFSSCGSQALEHRLRSCWAGA